MKRKLLLSYDYKDEKYFLNQVKLSNGAGESMPPTVITYGQDNKVLVANKSTINNTSTNFSATTSRYFTAADIDGDGISELIEVFDGTVNGLDNIYVRASKFKQENEEIIFDYQLWQKGVGHDMFF